MKRIPAVFLSVLLAASSLAGCADARTDLMQNITPNTVSEMELHDVSDAAVTDFAVRLFQSSLLYQNAEEAGRNMLISPLSVLSALSMTANGAEGETLTQMEAVLGMPVEELNSWISGYMAGLPKEKKYKLNLANSIWFTDRDSFTVNEAFLQTNADYYGAGIYRAPFDESTCEAINNWVAENTDDMIEEIIDRIPDEAVMYLVNALAFDAEWQTAYSEYAVRDGIFTAEDGTEKQTEMMYSEEYSYLEDRDAVGFIKYYTDRKYAFAALLPDEGVTVAEYVSSLTGDDLLDLLNNARTVAVDTAVPKFVSEYDVEMSAVLEQMGMTDAFDSGEADFSGIGSSTEGNLAISRVLHKTFISVDEKGTKAGAATAVEVVTESVSEPPEYQVYLDRPFVYMLIDCETGLPFFIGTMMDPTV